MKVFEFAKEIGVETLGLMDRIRKWNIPVKSHMATLDSDTIELIREKLEQESGKKKKKKKTAKKKVAKKATAAKKTTTAKKKTTTKKAATTKKVAKKKKTVAKKKTTVSKKKAAEAEAAPVKKIIRRRASEMLKPKDAETEAEVAIEAAETETAAVEATAEAPAAEAPEAVVAEAAETITPEAEVEAKVETETKEAAPEKVEEEAPADEKTVDEDGKPVSRAGVKRVFDMKTGKSDGQPAPRSRGSNIVGKMDLSKLKKYETQRTQAPQQTRNLRPGFAPSTTPRLDLPNLPPRPEDDRGRKHDPKKPGVAPRSEGKEEVVPTFAATEFRKREMLFQPKKKRGQLNRQALQTEITQAAAHKRIVKVDATIKVGDLAKEMSVKVPQLLKALMKNGITASINETVDAETAALIAQEFNYEIQNVHKTITDLVDDAAFGDLEAEPVPRPPVVTVMGHVDHGKTTLLDAIRKADVVSTEAGGITQHIGAYNVKLDNGTKITFIDTPGHAAFTEMRARGANVTDIVILIVAADDGAMPQTIEAINHAKNAGVPILVAVNKIDRPNANQDKIRQQLAEHELVSEDWGGTTIFNEVSALKKEGIKELLENLGLMAEMAELKGNPKRSGTGIVIESKVEKGRGIVASLIVRDGSVRIGQYIAAGTARGKIRAMFNEHGKGIKEVLPGEPVEILGLDSTPSAGERFDICKDEETTDRIITRNRNKKEQAEAIPAAKSLSLEDLFSKVKAGDVKELPIILKTDVAGSGEAIRASLEKLSTEEVKVKIIHSAVGGITESDVLLATSSKGIILGFNVRPDAGARNMSQSNGIETKIYSVIYELIDDVKAALSGLLAPEIVENTIGHAEVRELFKVPKAGTVAGCFVKDGKILRANQVRLIRNNVVVYEGKLLSLRRFKDDVREVASGYECGIGIENYNDVKVGDVIESFEKQEIARQI